MASATEHFFWWFAESGAVALDGSSSGICTNAAALDVERELAGSSSGACTISADLKVQKAYRANIIGLETGDLKEAYATGGTLSVQSSIKKSGTYALRINPTTSALGWARFRGWDGDGRDADFNPSSTKLYTAFHMRIATAPSANSEEIWRSYQAASDYSKVRINSSRYLDFYSSSDTKIGTGTTQLNLDTWYLVEVYIKQGTSDYELRINGSTEYSGTTLNPGSIDSVVIGKIENFNSEGYDIYFDNIRFDATDWCGEGAVVRMAPDANGTYTDYTGDYTDVDEVPVSEADYWSSATSGHKETCNFESTSSAGISGTIKTAQLWLWAGGSGSPSYSMLVRSGTTDSETGSVGHAWDMRGYPLYEDPNTDVAWTTGGLDAVQGGVHNQANWSSTVAHVSMMVEFEIVDIELEGSSSGAATIAAALDVLREIAGQSDGACTIGEALLDIQPGLAGQSDGQSSISALVGFAVDLAGQIDGQSSISALLDIALALAGQSDAACTISSALLDAQPLLAAQPDGQSSISADLTIQGLVELDGSSDGQSSISATLDVLREIAGQSDGQSSTSALLGFAHDLAGQSDGTASNAADLRVTREIASQSDGQSSIAALLSLDLPFAGQSDGQSSISADLTVTKADILLEATVNAQSSVSAPLSLMVELAGQSDAQSSIAALVGLDFLLAGQSDAACTTAADIPITRGLSGVSTAQSTVSADAILELQLSGASGGFGGTTADIIALYVLAGTVNATCTISAQLAEFWVSGQTSTWVVPYQSTRWEIPQRETTVLVPYQPTTWDISKDGNE